MIINDDGWLEFESSDEYEQSIVDGEPCPVGNYYGRPTLVDVNGTHYLVIDDYDGVGGQMVSAEFAAAWIKEFLR